MPDAKTSQEILTELLAATVAQNKILLAQNELLKQEIAENQKLDASIRQMTRVLAARG